MLAANVLLAMSVTAVREARAFELNGNAFMEVDPIDPRYRPMVALGSACDPSTTVQTDNGAVCGIVVAGINVVRGHKHLIRPRRGRRGPDLIPPGAVATGKLRWRDLVPYAAAELTRLSLNPGLTIKQAIADVRKRRRRKARELPQ